MKVINLDKFEKKPLTVFVLSYIAMRYFVDWSAEIRHAQNIQIVLVDNGKQPIPKELEHLPLIQTSQNIGCAGGWNLICNFGFNHLALSKLIICQDDSMCNEHMLSTIWDNANDDVLAGAYDRSFEFALFSLTKNYWETVGLFDENFLFAGCEDNDYKHRAMLLNKQVSCARFSADLNSSLSCRTLRDSLRDSASHNVAYIERKWGSQYEFTNPFNNIQLSPTESPVSDSIRNTYHMEQFPSLFEIQTFNQTHT